MPLSAQKQRERRAAKRAAEAQDAARGQRKPRNRAPTGCYWDPQPGEATGTWRKFLTDEVVDVAAARRARDAGKRREETTRAARARPSALGSMGAGCSSVELMTQRTSASMAAHLSAEAPARRVRDIEYAAELLGLRLDVPWSIWDGYEAGGREPGILWRYDAEEGTFTVRFENELDLNDLEDVSWAEVLDDVPMAESDGEPATLHRLDDLPLVRAPRGAQPQDGVWRMRGGLWINRHGMALYEEDAGESDSADDDELGSARPAASHTFTSHPLCNHRFCVRRWLQRLQSYAFGPRPLYLTRFRFTPSPRPPRTRPRLRMRTHSLSKPPCARRCPRARVRPARHLAVLPRARWRFQTVAPSRS